MRRLFLCASIPLALWSCARTTSTPVPARDLPLGSIEIRRDERSILKLAVNIAETPEARARGLMGVRNLSDDEGMAFVNENASRDPFFMKNTLIPLDIAFWDRDGVIVDILHMEPCRADPCPLYHPNREYIGAVETNAGLLERKGVRVGDRVILNRIR